MKVTKLSERDLTDLHEGMDLLIERLQAPGAKRRCYETPVQFLQTANIRILKHITRLSSLRRQLVNGVWKILDFLSRAINECMRCKISVLLIMLAVLGKAGMAWGRVMLARKQIIDSLKDFFDINSAFLDSIFEEIFAFTKRISPGYLALQICRSLGKMPIGAKLDIGQISGGLS